MKYAKKMMCWSKTGRLVVKEDDALNLHAIIKKLGAGLSSIKELK